MDTREIKIKIHDESDLFSPFDPDQEILSEDVFQYISRNYMNKHRNSNEKYVIRIISDMPVNEDKIRKRLQEQFSQQQDNLKFELKKISFKEVSLGVFGMILLFIWFFFSSGADNINLELLSIVGTVAVWESVSIAFMVRPDLYKMKKSFDKVLKADIIVEAGSR